MIRVWSPTKVLRYSTCPRQWALMETRPRGRRTEFDLDLALPLKLGIIAHAAMQAAYEAARDGLRPFRPGEYMAVYSDAALDALNTALEGFGLAESAEAAQLEEEVLAVLDRLPRPRPGAVLGVERRLDNVVDGVPFTNVLDLILQTGATSLHLRDWKRRNIKDLPKTLELLDDPQMCGYRAAIVRHFPWVTRVTVGLYSMISNREVSVELPLARAMGTMAGEVAITRKAEKDTLCSPTPNGSNCQRCPVKARCPVWTVPQQL